MAKISIGATFSETENEVLYEIRTMFGTATTIRINKNNYKRKYMRYLRPGDREFDFLRSGHIIDITKHVTADDSITDFEHGGVTIEVQYCIDKGTIKKAVLFAGALKSKAMKELRLEA